MSQFANSLKKRLNSRSIKYGIPFLIAIVGGSFGLKEFTKLRFEYTKVKAIDRRELKEKGIEMKEPGTVTLESEYKKIKDLDIDNWEQKRGPRPWEETS